MIGEKLLLSTKAQYVKRVKVFVLLIHFSALCSTQVIWFIGVDIINALTRGDRSKHKQWESYSRLKLYRRQLSLYGAISSIFDYWSSASWGLVYHRKKLLLRLLGSSDNSYLWFLKKAFNLLMGELLTDARLTLVGNICRWHWRKSRFLRRFLVHDKRRKYFIYKKIRFLKLWAWIFIYFFYTFLVGKYCQIFAFLFHFGRLFIDRLHIELDPCGAKFTQFAEYVFLPCTISPLLSSCMHVDFQGHPCFFYLKKY